MLGPRLTPGYSTRVSNFTQPVWRAVCQTQPLTCQTVLLQVSFLSVMPNTSTSTSTDLSTNASPSVSSFKSTRVTTSNSTAPFANMLWQVSWPLRRLIRPWEAQTLVQLIFSPVVHWGSQLQLRQVSRQVWRTTTRPSKYANFSTSALQNVSAFTLAIVTPSNSTYTSAYLSLSASSSVWHLPCSLWQAPPLPLYPQSIPPLVFEEPRPDYWNTQKLNLCRSNAPQCFV